MINDGMTIGAAARKSGCPAATIRYYEEIGLLRPVARGVNGRRIYGWPEVSRLRLIRRLRSLDFGIDRVRQLIDAIEAETPACLDVRDLALAQLDVVRARRAELEALERTLIALASTCTEACAGGATPDCSIVRDIAA